MTTDDPYRDERASMAETITKLRRALDAKEPLDPEKARTRRAKFLTIGILGSISFAILGGIWLGDHAAFGVAAPIVLGGAGALYFLARAIAEFG